MKNQVHKFILPLLVSSIIVACADQTPRPTPTATDIPSAANQVSHLTFALSGEQAQEIAVFMDFIRAYNNARLDEALALLSEDVGGTDCDYRQVKVIVFR